MFLAQQILSEFDTIVFGLQLILVFGMPIVVFSMGYYFIKKKAIKKVWIVKLITVVVELISLIPLIGLIYSSEDGVWLIFVPLVILATLIDLFPFIFPFVSWILCNKRRKQNKTISRQIVFSVLLEGLSIAILILWFVKDRF